MNAPNPPAVVISAPKPASALFASVRASSDLTLAAFGAALLAAFALQAGAFLPPLAPPAGAADVASAAPVEAAPASPAPAVVARRPATVRAPAAGATEPCTSPRS